MNVTETANEGLNRAWRVVVPATEIDANVDRRLSEIGKTIKMPGFRPGKVPLSLIKKRYGPSVMGEVLEKTVQDSSAKLLQDHEIRPATEPKIEVVSFADGADLEYIVAVETLPVIEPADLGDLALERLVTPVDDAAVDAALERIANGNPQFETVAEPRPAENGDQLLIDFAGTVDGEPRPGMDGQDHPLELGAGNFIPGFEDQLIGMAPGESRTITVTFPAEYHAAELAGKEAVFVVTAKELRARAIVPLDDDFAKKLNFEDFAALKDAARRQIEGEYGRLARLKLKRALMDALAEKHDFPVPQGMVDLEFDSIWKQVQPELTVEEKEKPEDEVKAEYRAIAERRVRLGLLLSEIGQRNAIVVAQEELNRGLIAEARRYPGQEMEVIEAYRKNPRALDSLRAPIYEDKVVDHILTTVTLNDRIVTPEELAREDDEPETPAIAVQN
jgi:trigger factor